MLSKVKNSTFTFSIIFLERAKKRKGSNDSRPRERKITPCSGVQEKGGWAASLSVELPAGCLGQTRTILPPLDKTGLSLSGESVPFLLNCLMSQSFSLEPV